MFIVLWLKGTVTSLVLQSTFREEKGERGKGTFSFLFGRTALPGQNHVAWSPLMLVIWNRVLYFFLSSLYRREKREKGDVNGLWTANPWCLPQYKHILAILWWLIVLTPQIVSNSKAVITALLQSVFFNVCMKIEPLTIWWKHVGQIFYFQYNSSSCILVNDFAWVDSDF